MLGKRLIFAASALVGFNAGLIYTWPRGLFALIKDGKVQTSLSLQDQVYILNTRSLSKLLGAILTAYLMEKHGRRTTLLVLSVINLAGCVPNFFDASTWSFCLSQALQGFFISAYFSVVPIMVGETIESSVRGAVTAVSFVTLTMGSITTSLLSMSNFLLYIGIPVIPSVAFLVLAFFLKETPHFIMMKDGKDKAREQFVWLRGLCDEDELSKLEETVQFFNKNSRSYKDLFRRSTRKSIGITVLFVVLAKITGYDTVTNLVSSILPESSISSSTAIILLSISGMASTIFSLFFIDRVGRKPLSFVSYVGAGISFFIAATWYLLEDSSSSKSPSNLWLILFAFVLIEIFSNLGSQFLHHILIGELFSVEVRGRASMLVTFASSISLILYNQVFTWALQFLGNASTLYICVGFHVIACICVYVILFETKGKTLDEIQEDISKTTVSQRL